MAAEIIIPRGGKAGCWRCVINEMEQQKNHIATGTLFRRVGLFVDHTTATQKFADSASVFSEKQKHNKMLNK